MTSSCDRETPTSFDSLELSRGPAGSAGTELHVFDDGAQVRRSILPGGIRVITETVPGLRSAGVGLWFGVGSRDEAAGQEGSTHFLEHLLFKGTRKRDARAIAEAFDMIGGESNAATSKEHTSYYARVQGKDTSVALEVLSDMVTSSLIDPSEVETERGVIISELADAADDPQDVAQEAFARAAFGQDTPLGRPIGGTSATVGALSRDAIWEHYQRTYASDSVVVAAAGAVNHEEICQQVLWDFEQAGWNLSASATPRLRRFELEPEAPLHVQDYVVPRESEQSHLYLTCQGIASRDERRWALNLLTTIMGGGMSSRLFQEVRERRGLAYTTYAFDVSYAGTGAFGLYAGCAPQSVDEVCSVMVGEWEKLAEHGVSERELQRARGQIRGSLVLGGEDSLARMGRLGRAEIVTGRLRSMEENLRLLDAVTGQEIQELAAWLLEHERARVLVGPTVG